MLTAKQFKVLFPRAKFIPEDWANKLNAEFPKYKIDTANKIAAYLAQCGHESSGLSRLDENLNYSIQGLLKIFPKYFTLEQAKQYARNPRKIASRVYGNRMGNGGEETGDGYKYRGRGIIQLTGKNNYSAFSIDTRGDYSILDTPEYLSTLYGAVESSLWFWDKNNLNSWIEKNDFDGLSDLINRGRKTKRIGDAIGYSDRLKTYEIIQRVLGE